MTPAAPGIVCPRIKPVAAALDEEVLEAIPLCVIHATFALRPCILKYTATWDDVHETLEAVEPFGQAAWAAEKDGSEGTDLPGCKQNRGYTRSPGDNGAEECRQCLLPEYPAVRNLPGYDQALRHAPDIRLILPSGPCACRGLPVMNQNIWR